MSAAEIARELLAFQRDQDAWRNKVEASGCIEIDEPISSSFLLFFLALDVLGHPKNVEGEYCRDWMLDVYLLMVVEHRDIDGFIDVATGKRQMPESWSSDEELEAFIYPKTPTA